MTRYKVVQEAITEEVIEIEAESEVQAIDLIADGHGELVDQTLWRPQVIGVEELEDDNEYTVSGPEADIIAD